MYTGIRLMCILLGCVYLFRIRIIRVIRVIRVNPRFRRENGKRLRQDTLAQTFAKYLHTHLYSSCDKNFTHPFWAGLFSFLYCCVGQEFLVK